VASRAHAAQVAFNAVHVQAVQGRAGRGVAVIYLGLVILAVLGAAFVVSVLGGATGARMPV